MSIREISDNVEAYWSLPAVLLVLMSIGTLIARCGG